MAIKKFRSMIQSEELYRNFMKTDEYLLRWIRVANFDLELARMKLRKNLSWRKENKIDSILREDFSFFVKVCPFSDDGEDKSGRPLILFGLGQCDIRKIVISGKADQLQRYIYHVLELSADKVEVTKLKVKHEKGKDVRDLVVIVDTNGFNLRQHGCLRCVPAILSLFTAYEDYYPEYLHQLNIINFPRIATPLLNLIFEVLSSETKKITKVYGFDKNEWEKGLLEGIEPSELPIQYGGLKN